MMDREHTDAQVMQDFVFGRLEVDENTLAAERYRWSSVRHGHDITPLDPGPGQPIEIVVSVGRDVLVDRMAAYITTDGSDPTGSRGTALNGQAIDMQRFTTEWQPLYWDYVELWRGEIPSQPEGTHVRYRIEGWSSSQPDSSQWSREPNLDGTMEWPTLYGFMVDQHRPPDWAKKAILYHIFIDRFAPVESRWLQPGQLNSFIGGTLRGVTANLDYIQNLGCTAIWLSPIFVCQSYHGYDTIDYFAIDPRFGNEDDLRELVAEAHHRNLRIILDFVANHTSDLFPPFQEALEDPDSPYSSWFDFDDRYLHGYRTFFTTKTMPQLDLDDPGARSFIIEAATYWLEHFQIDGYRLDYAAGPSHDFWSAFGYACKSVNPDCWLFGEVTMGSNTLRTYSGRLDGCLDFNFTRHIRRLCLGRVPEAGALTSFAASLVRRQRYFPEDYIAPAFIDNHDMNRFLWMVGNDKAQLRLALGLLIAFGGPPIIYYGTEVGLSQPRHKGPHREESRHPMLWGEAQDTDMLSYFRMLTTLRRQRPSLVKGELQTLYLNEAESLWLCQRTWQDDRILVAVNTSLDARVIELPTGDFVDSVGVLESGAADLAAKEIRFFTRRGPGEVMA